MCLFPLDPPTRAGRAVVWGGRGRTSLRSDWRRHSRTGPIGHIGRRPGDGVSSAGEMTIFPAHLPGRPHAGIAPQRRDTATLTVSRAGAVATTVLANSVRKK